MRALRDSRATPNPLERCYDWCCVVKRPFRKSDAGSAKRSTLHDSFQSLFLTLLLLIQSEDRYGPNGNPRFTIKILRGNTIFQNIRISDLTCHGTSRRSQRRTIMIQRPECKYFSSFHPVGSYLDPYACRKKSCRLGGTTSTTPQRHPPRQVKKKHKSFIVCLFDMNHLIKHS